jgi:hypothetical protein
MRVIEVDNVNQALAEGLRHLHHFGVEEESRNGPVLVSPVPVTTVYRRPTRRVLISPVRNANPFFHFMEALWMLAGRNDLAFPMKFNKRFAEYSDDGKYLHGAYGHRWREHFGMDQLPIILEELTHNPNSRRAVLAMWDPPADWSQMGGTLGSGGPPAKDIPCNTQVYFRIIKGLLDMTVTCRSNDIWWGAYGANAVHFSFLQEYMASALGLGVGRYYQVSNNYHLYPANLPSSDLLELADRARQADLYTTPGYAEEYDRAWLPRAPTDVYPEFPIMRHGATEFDKNLTLFMENPFEVIYSEPLFEVATPMLAAWECYKAKEYEDAFDNAKQIAADDWRIACGEWLSRKEAKRRAA